MRILYFLIFYLFTLYPSIGFTQDFPEGLPEDFTGTLADEEDEDNPEFRRRKEELDAFGADRRPKNAEETSYESDTPNYLLKFNFDSQVVFADKEGQAYMEINYNTKIEQEIALIGRRWRASSEAKFTSDITGKLAGSDLFTCNLDITIDAYPVDLMTRLKTIEDPEQEIETYEAAIQIRLKPGYQEKWFSNCTDLSGKSFNTSGGPEKHNLTILENLKPSLNGITISNFDLTSGGETDLTVDPMETLDDDLNEILTLSGNGSISIEPL